jgi:hypothetical protein
VTPFEYLFTLFGLLLGFILVEVLSGLVGVLQLRHQAGPGAKPDVHVGWLTPLLGVFTIFDVATWWGNAWDIHDRVPFGYDTMFGGILLCGIYYFAASMVFPRDPRLWPDLDEWFWLHRRQVLGCILVANLAWLFLDWRPDIPLFVLLPNFGIYYGALLVGIFARKRWVVLLALGLLIALFASYTVMDHLHREYGWLS